MQSTNPQTPTPPPNATPTIRVDATIIRTSTIVFVAVAFGVWTLIANSFAIGVDSSDRDGWNRSGVAVVTDHQTGLQYLRAPGGGITPRLEADGRQIRSR